MINISSGNYIPLADSILVCDGNSITAFAREADLNDYPQYSYPTQLTARAEIVAANMAIYNVGVGGQDINNMISRSTSFVDVRYDANKPCRLVCWEFTNQLFNNSSVSSATAAFEQYCRARKAVGWKIIVVTALARTRKPSWGTVDAYNLALDQANSWLRLNWPNFADQIIDVRKIPQLDPVTTTYIPDGTHPNQVGLGFFVNALIPALKRVTK